MSNLQHKTLTNREALTALLEGKEIQELDKRGVGEETPEWCSVDNFPLFSVENLDEPFKRFIFTDDPYIYRIKPETKTVRVCNGVELPDCITEPLKNGETYYVAGVSAVVAMRWSRYSSKEVYVKCGFAYLSREDAEVHHKALAAYETIEKEVLE